MSLEALEPRTLMAVVAPPVVNPQIPVDITGFGSFGTLTGGDVYASEPTVAINRYNPNKIVSTWVIHDPAAGDAPDYFLRGAYSIDAGLSWTTLPSLPNARIDPATGTNPLPFNAITNSSVTFDAKDNFYVLEIQHSDSFASGVVLVQPYSFSGNAPVASGGATTITSWFQGGDATIWPNPQTSIHDAVIMADDTLGAFTDPDTSKTQTNIGAGRVYVAWQTNMEVPTGYTGPFNPNTIELLVSSDQGATFSTPTQASGGHFQGNSRYSAPQIAISQGRLPGTNSVNDLGVTGGQVTVLYDDFLGGRSSSPVVDIIQATPFLPTVNGVSRGTTTLVATTTVLGAQDSIFPLVSAATPGRGIGPGAVIASNNTLGSFSPYQGRLYVAYVDRYDTIRFGTTASRNQADNTDIFLRYSDDGGATWRYSAVDPVIGLRLPVNDDVVIPSLDRITVGANNPARADANGIFEGSVDFNVSGGIFGRSQFQPSLAVDPVTGILALSYEDTRYDASRSRTVYSIQLLTGDTDNAGNLTSSKSIYADLKQTAFDQTTFQNVVVGPIPSNTTLSPDAGIASSGGIGNQQGLAINNGQLIALFASNLNGLDGSGAPADLKSKIRSVPMTYQAGPRVVASTQGPVASQTVIGLQSGQPITFNNQRRADGTPIVDGFVVTFDRPIDARTFTPADVTVTYRPANPLSGGGGIPISVSSVTPLTDGGNVARVGGTTRFLVRFDGRSDVGTYSYTVGPDIRDFTRSVLAINTYYADQSPSNLPAVPPLNSGGTGDPARDIASSIVKVPLLANDESIIDLDVLVTLTHQSSADLVLRLYPPPGFLPSGGSPFILLSQNRAGGQYTDTTFDAQARLLIGGTNPNLPAFSGLFRPEAAGLARLQAALLQGGRPTDTDWTLEIEDTRIGNVGQLISWGLRLTTSTRNPTTFATSLRSAATGLLMDQDGSGIGGRNPSTGGETDSPGSLVLGTSPGDVYAVPLPQPRTATVFDGQTINPPYDSTTLPLQVTGPQIIRSFVPGTTLRTLDNLVTDAEVNAFNIVFDRDMNPNSLTLGNHVVRLVTPSGTYTEGSVLPDGSTIHFVITADPNSDPSNPNSDPDLSFPRTYRINFQKIPAGGGAATPLNLSVSGTYSVTLASDVQSKAGDALDTNQNAGLDLLRSTPSAGTRDVVYASQAPVAIGPGSAKQTTYVSTINVTDSFLVKNVVVQLNISYPRDPELTAVLVAPDGTAVQLFTNVGNVGDGKNFINTIFDDTATTAIQDGGPPFFVGPFTPQEPLSQFVDHVSLGTWQLVITTSVALTSATGQINSWSLTLDEPLSNSGLGETVADRATESFRIFTLDPTNPLSSTTWTSVGPAGEGAKQRGGNAEVAGRVGALATDPSDPTGNTVYAGAASGGVWKTANFLTNSPSGPTWVPLTDNSPAFGLNVASIAIFPRNNDPNQSIIFAATGDVDSTGDPAVRGGLTSRGVGFLRSMDGGATWTLLDSRNNSSPTARDRFFASVAGQAGVTSYKIVVDPVATRNNQVIVYAVLSDIDANGQLATTGGKGGIWKSLDTGTTWTLMRGGEATDLTLDYNSVNADSGNLDFLYAAFRGDGVYFSPNAGQNFNLMTGTVGNPLIQSTDFTQPQPVPVGASDTPNGKTGRIVLAKPGLVADNPLQNLIQQGWLYAAVVNFVPGDPVQTGGGSTFLALYMTKDFGQNWTRLALPGVAGFSFGELPTNNPAQPTIPLSGSGTLVGAPFSLGNFALSLAVDPTNANVTYVGGSSEFREIGLIRVDATGVHDPHAFYMDNSNPTASSRFTPGLGPVILNGLAAVPAGFTPPYDAFSTPFINLIRDPRNPFQAGATILVRNTTQFTNDGSHVSWMPFDRALAPDPFALATDPWSVPTRNVHEIITSIDPLTGQTRFLFATDQGVYTAVADGQGNLVGSIGGSQSRDDNTGNVLVVNGSRNGNLSIAEVRSGAAHASQLTADLASLTGFFYTASQDVGIGQSDPNIINPGTAGYGNLSYNVGSVNGPPRPTTDRGTAWSVATQQTFEINSKSGQQTAGTTYAYRISEDLVGLDLNLATGTVRPSTDTVQVNTVGRTFGLYQTANGGNTPDSQFPFRVGSNVVVNPLAADQMLISSQAGRIFATTTRGQIWSEIGNPNALDGTYAPALAYGAPDPLPPGGGLGSLNNYLLAGTTGGRIFVTFTAGGGNGNAWIPLSGGLDGSPVRSIVTNPTRGSHEAYAVTERGVYHINDTRTGGNWTNVTGNLFGVVRGILGNTALGTQTALQLLTSVQADWRYLIPDDFANPTGSTHPMLYVAGEGGVFRSLDGGTTWGLFPDGAVSANGTANPNSLLNSPLGEGGGLPNAIVTDLDMSLGIIDPATGRAAAKTIDPNTGQTVAAPNILMASTFGRGTYAIRLVPIVFPNTATNPSVLQLSPTKPAPGGSDSGTSATDRYTNVTNLVVEGLSEQSAFGNVVTIALFDASDPTVAPRPITLVPGTNQTDGTGRFSVQISPSYFTAFDPSNPNAPTSDGPKKILVQATNGSGTTGNLAPLEFILDTTPPAAIVDGRTPAPGSPAPDLNPPLVDRPDLAAASDSGFSDSDNITNVTTGLTFTMALAAGEPSVTRVFLVRDNDTNIVDSQTGVADPGRITLRDPGPVSEGTHFYYTYQVDLAGNKGPFSEKLAVRIDTTAPARPNAPILDPTLPAPNGSDSGPNKTDNITNVNQPYLSGLAESGGLVQIVDAAGNVLGPVSTTTPNVGGNGKYSVQTTNVLADGTYSLRVRELDLAGNISQVSLPITVTILSRPIATPTLLLVAADDTGIVGDNITSVTKPRLVGTGTPGLNVQLILDSSTATFPGGVLPGGVITPLTGQTPIVVRPDGSFSLQFPTDLPRGTYVVHALISDVAGNIASSATLTLQIIPANGGGGGGGGGGQTPGKPTLALLPDDDSGIKGDNTTVTRRPRFAGLATFSDGSIAAGVVVELSTTAGQLLSTTTTSTTGAFTLNLPSDLINGQVTLQARIRDVAGNPGPASDPVLLKIVTVAGDADNDGKADLDSFSRTNSQFTFGNSSSPNSTAAPFLTQAGDIPFQGDFDGDGKIDYGFYRYSTGQWFVRQSRAGTPWSSLEPPATTCPSRPTTTAMAAPTSPSGNRARASGRSSARRTARFRPRSSACRPWTSRFRRTTTVTARPTWSSIASRPASGWRRCPRGPRRCPARSPRPAPACRCPMPTGGSPT